MKGTDAAFVPAHLPYCGTPPSPEQLLTRWNLDPILISCLAAVALLYAFGKHYGTVPTRGQRVEFYCGWLVTSAALISPLCALSVSLFAARVSQHAILVLIAAPLVAAGCPHNVLKPLWPFHAYTATPVGFLRRLHGPLPAAVLFAVTLWFWHMPAPYSATFESTLVYWTMHLTLFGSAVTLWSALSIGDSTSLPQVIAAGVLSSLQMTFLGALITLAPHALYTPHLLTTAAWNLSPLQDQQIGGLIMWVPGCAAFLVVGIAGLAIAMRRADRIYT